MSNQPFWRGHHLYAVCGTCNKLVRLNKPLFGDLHLCSPDESPRIKRSVTTYTDNEKSCGFIEFQDD